MDDHARWRQKVRHLPAGFRYTTECKTSTRISVEAVGIALLETRVEANVIAFPLQVPSNSKLPTFLLTAALQRKLSCRAIARKGVGGLCGGALPAYIPVSGLASFLSFQIWLRLVLRPEALLKSCMSLP